MKTASTARFGRREIGLLAACLTLVGCPEEKVVCPPGHTAQGIYCYPNAPPDAGLQPLDVGSGDTGKNTKDSGGTDTGAVNDTAGAKDVGAKDTGPVDTGPQDTGPKDAGPPKSPVGAACADDLDCLVGLSCFSWTKGYCTMLSCNAAGGQACPGTSACWGESKAKHICVLQCDEPKDCRVDDGYSCKRLTNKFGGIDARLCVPSGKAPTGLKCEKPLDCKGEATCITDMAGGYCARIGCGPSDPCGAGTACVLRNGKPMCLKTCVADVQCDVGTKLPRKCVARTDLQKKPVKVCLDSDKAGAIGEPCGADLDCDSGKCVLVAKGTCKVGGKACLTDQQCGAAGPCVADKAKEQGVCGKVCSNKQGCPTGSVCVPGDQFLIGTCQPQCKGPQDVDTCKPLPGTSCVFGQPIAPPFGSASPTYACARVVKGQPGSLCTKKDDCASKDCTTNTKGTAGYCTAECGGNNPECPFGTRCIKAGLSQCEKMCAVDYDCPPLMACQTGGGGKKLCQIP